MGNGLTEDQRSAARMAGRDPNEQAVADAIVELSGRLPDVQSNVLAAALVAQESLNAYSQGRWGSGISASTGGDSWTLDHPAGEGPVASSAAPDYSTGGETVDS